MMQPLDDWVVGLLLRLSPAERKALNRRVMYELRRSQARRIAAQQNPDGTPYQPRSGQKNLRGKKGKIKRKAMFAKLRTQRHLKVRSDANSIEVGFRGRDAVVAATHQEGSVRVRRGRRFVTPKRILLGANAQDVQKVELMMLMFLTEGSV